MRWALGRHYAPPHSRPDCGLYRAQVEVHMSLSLRRSLSLAANASVLPAELRSGPLLKEVASHMRALVWSERLHWRSYLAYSPLIWRIRELTMVPDRVLMGLAEQVQTVLSERVP